MNIYDTKHILICKGGVFCNFFNILKDFSELLKVNNINKMIQLYNILLIYEVAKCGFCSAILGVSPIYSHFGTPDLKIW